MRQAIRLENDNTSNRYSTNKHNVNSSNSTQNENSTALSSGTINSNGDDNVGFNGNLDSSSLGRLDVATQLPKLSTAQIAEIIKKHFNRSSVISTSDAEGIYNAQKTTGMSALAILGIGALESGWVLQT